MLSESKRKNQQALARFWREVIARVAETDDATIKRWTRLIQSPPEFVTKADIARRWGKTRQLVNHKSQKDAAFPEVMATVNEGKTQIYLLADVIEYERVNRIKVEAE